MVRNVNVQNAVYKRPYVALPCAPLNHSLFPLQMQSQLRYSFAGNLCPPVLTLLTSITTSMSHTVGAGRVQTVFLPFFSSKQFTRTNTAQNRLP